jgi:hypothetical protein
MVNNYMCDGVGEIRKMTKNLEPYKMYGSNAQHIGQGEMLSLVLLFITYFLNKPQVHPLYQLTFHL